MRTQVYRSIQDLFVSGRGQLYLLALAAVCLAVEGIYVAVVPPVTGFETWIYEAYPPLFWIALLLCTALVIVVLLTSSISSRSFYGRALTLLTANYGMLLLLPTFRGYQLHDNGIGDILVHLGHVRTIVVRGIVPADLWYPFEHILMAVFTMFGVPLEESSMLFTLVFLILFATTTGTFLHSLLRHKFALAAGTAAAIPLLMGPFTVEGLPSIFSVFLLPVLMTFTHRFRRTFAKRYLSLLCLTVFAIIIFHPVTSLFVVVLLFSSWAFTHIYNQLTGSQIPTPDYNLALAMIPIIFIWYASFDKTWFMVNSRIQTVMGSTPSPIGATTGESAVLTLQQTMLRFIQLYGAVFIYLIIAAVVTSLIVYRIYHLDFTYSEAYIIFLFVIGFFTSLILMVSPLESSAPIRNSRFMIVIAVVLVSLSIVWAVQSNSHKNFTVILTAAIIVATVLSAGIIYQPNIQMTNSEFEGVEYMTEYNDGSATVYHLKMGDKVEEYTHSAPRTKIDTYHFDRENQFPPGLGYTENETAAETFGNAFLVTKEYDTEFYSASYFFPAQQEVLFVYNESHKSKLRMDVTVDKVYENGGFEGWRVNNPRESSETVLQK